MTIDVHNMNFGQERCATTEAEVLHGAAEDRREAEYERCLALAWDEFHAGRLDDALDELIIDQALDARECAKYLCWPEKELEPRCAIRDFMATVEGIVETRADEIQEYGE